MTTGTIGRFDELLAVAASGAAEGLRLAAAPVFAVMALLTGILGGAAPDMMCGAARAAFPLSGMMPMYLLMSLFHLSPWLKRIAPRARRNPA